MFCVNCPQEIIGKVGTCTDQAKRISLQLKPSSCHIVSLCSAVTEKVWEYESVSESEDEKAVSKPDAASKVAPTVSVAVIHQVAVVLVFARGQHCVAFCRLRYRFQVKVVQCSKQFPQTRLSDQASRIIVVHRFDSLFLMPDHQAGSSLFSFVLVTCSLFI